VDRKNIDKNNGIKKEMSMKKQRTYDKEFKLNAVKLYKESGKTCGEVAQNLGIPKSTLYTWALEYEESGDLSFKGSGIPKACNEELFLLRKELADVKMERDILKKAVAIFSRPKG
jgi:transposase-like protein